MHDIVIRGGELVDGTGAEPVRGDLAMDGCSIAEVGQVTGRGRREIDAQGMTVTPGFIDLHTHLDAQIGWDPALTPVSWHGVTTVLMGNCGVTFAPCKPADQELLAGMMETVEDIPKNAILTGLPWNWEDYGGYLDAIERLKPGINVAGMVGHCAVRFYVMGERAVEEQASDAERKQMADIVGMSIDRGAVGFSTNRLALHRLPDGRPVPGTFADPAELVEIGKAVGQRSGLMQAVLGLINESTARDVGFDVLTQMARASQSRILFAYGAGPEADSGLERRQAFEELRAAAGDVTAVTHVRSSGSMYGLQSRLPVAGETWRKLQAMDLAGRLEAIDNTDTVAKLVEEAKRDGAMRLPPDNLFYLGTAEPPDYTAGPERNLQAMADAAGEHWCETLLRLSLESKGLGLFNHRAFARNMNALGDLIEHEHVFPSLGDAGAHVSQVMDAGWPTFLLSHWVRDAGRYTMGEGIRRLTSGPARVVGIADRGTLKPGMRADVNVFDADAVVECQPQLVHDFPGGAPRYIQRSKGYHTTIVNGEVNVVNGEHTGIRAGQVLRHMP